MNIKQHRQTHRFQAFYLLHIFLCLSGLVFSPYAVSATFVPDVSELKSAPPEYQALDRGAINELLANRDSDVDYIQIDDMRFKVNPLVQNDGFSGTRWTNGNVYYQFDAAVTAINQQRWLDAAAEWSAAANLNFVARTTQTNYIYVKNDPGNWSYVGMIGGQQEMGIFNWTWKYIIAHEIGHALGLSHEQSRSDRDSFVTILWANITEGKENNFQIRATTNYGVYDFDSVLHYHKKSFSSNGLNTIEPLPAYSAWLDLIGQRNHLSSGDKNGMAQRYGSMPPVISGPDPADDSTVVEGASGQLLSVTASGATSGTIYYDDDSIVSYSTPATISGDYLEATIPYASEIMNNDGTNFWYVEATNAAGTTRYPDSGNLSFTVTLASNIDQYEPDNDSGQANTIESGAAQVHSIVPSDDRDWVMFSLTERSDFTVETSGTSGDTRMWLYNDSLAEIAFDDDDGNGLFSKITMTNLAAGTYFVEIDEFGNNDEIPSYSVIANYLSPQDEDILFMILPAIVSKSRQGQKHR